MKKNYFKKVFAPLIISFLFLLIGVYLTIKKNETKKE